MARFRSLLLFLLVAGSQLLFSNCEFTYTTVAPLYIIPGEPYQITTTLEKADNTPVTFKYKLTTPENSVAIIEETVRLTGPGHALTNFIGLPELLKKEHYYLRLTATDNAGRTKEARLSVRKDARQSAILIQTDKPIYKAGDMVKFRVFLLNGLLHPYENDKVADITVFDPAGNIIKLSRSAVFKKERGFVSEELELSKEPMLGNWKIEVETGNATEKEYHLFPVAEYVLPKYKVKISTTPSFVTFNDSKFTAEVRAMYSYGKPVIGTCTVELSSLNNSSVSGIPSAISKTSKLEEGTGLAKIEFDISSEIQDDDPNNDMEKSFQIFASCTDQASGNARNATTTITMHRTPYNIEVVKKPKDILPGFPVDIILKVATHDNIPVSDERENALEIQIDEDEPIHRSIPANGLVPLHMIGKTSGGYELTVTYKQTKEMLWLPSPFNQTGDFVQLKLVTREPVQGQPIEVMVKATKAFSALNLVMISNGLVVHSERIEGTGSTEQLIKITLPKNLSPKVKLLAYVFCNDNIISDRLDLIVKQEEMNPLRIAISDGIVQPGGDISINVTGQPNTFVGLRAVDQSVLLLRGDDDLTPEKLEDMGDRRSPSGKYIPWYLSGATAELYASGLGLMTNIEVKTFRLKLDDESRSSAGKAEEDAPKNEEPPSVPEPGSQQEPQPSPNIPIRVRSSFPETWIWEDLENAEGQLTLQKSVPDTITSWFISAFQINNENGLDLARETQKLTVFQPFFISLNLPYSVVKGEVLLLQVLVHNYQEEGVTVDVTLENQEGGFTFHKVEGAPSTMTKSVSLNASSISPVIFPIVPSKFGTITLSVRAVATASSQSVAGDAVRRTLIVRPPGIKHTQNSAILINFLKNLSFRRAKILADFPERRVEGADSLKVQVVGDVLGGTIDNLEELITLPTGCGEQNMNKFAPDVVILDYLTFTGQLTPQVEARAKSLLQTGYQNQLKNLNSDGSYSLWWEDGIGSTWLTAYVTKAFIPATRYIYIDKKHITQSLRFLMSKQSKDGSFTEKGYIRRRVWEESSNKLVTTAYTLLAIVEAQKAGYNLQELSPTRQTAKQIIDAGVQFLVDQTRGDKTFNDVYATNLISYTLHYIDHAMEGGYFLLYEYFLKLTEGFARRNRLDGTIFWRPIQSQSPLVNPASIEMSSYGLLTYLLRKEGKFSETVSIAKWLMKQRNPEGGFSSTQDTIMGITALAKFAEAIHTKENADSGVAVKLSYGKDDNSHTFYIGKENRTITQEYILPESTNEVSIEGEATGKGTAMAQLTWTYYVEAVDSNPAFELGTELTFFDQGSNLNMTIQYAYIGVGEQSNMAIMEVGAPSGYAFDMEELEVLRRKKIFQRFELEDKDSKLQLYFDVVERDAEIIILKLYRTHLVAKHAQGVVKIYDYYDNTLKAQDLYDVPQVLVCDVCKENEGCDLTECK